MTGGIGIQAMHTEDTCNCCSHAPCQTVGAGHACRVHDDVYTKFTNPLTAMQLALCELAAVINGDGLLGAPALRAKRLHLLHNLHALDHLAEHHVLAVEPSGLHGGDEELGAVGAGTGVGLQR